MELTEAGNKFNKKHFIYMLIFILTFAISFMLAEIIVDSIYFFGIPFIITLIISGVLIDKGHRLWFMVLLLGEGALIIVLALSYQTIFARNILFILLGILSGFTTCGLMANFADHTDEQFGNLNRSTVAGFIFSITWIIIAAAISAYLRYSRAPLDPINQWVYIGLLIFFGGVKFAGGICTIIIWITEGEAKSIIKYEMTGGVKGFFKDSFWFIISDKKYFTYWISYMLVWISQGMLSLLTIPTGGLSFLEISTYGFATGGLILVAGGYMIDKIGRKNMVIYGMILTTASFIVYIFDMGAVLTSGIAILVSTIFVIIADLAPADSRGRYSGIFIGLLLLGFLIGQIIGLGATTTNTFAYFIAGAILCGIGLILVLIFGKDTRGSEEVGEELTFTSNEEITP
ncbi:MAG: MFS transporter [Candidatus Lokiarchaeota archaeon]|nr:MFS transporter [Candidatus Lokiarchaeota archaeon]